MRLPWAEMVLASRNPPPPGIAQKPTELDFGHTFVALDPDGHRLRVFAANAA